MAKTAKKLSKKIIALIVCAAIIASLLFTYLGMYIAFVTAHGIECWRPDYAQEDIEPVLDRWTEDGNLSNEDYGFLFKQTGLTQLGVDRTMKKGAAGKERILEIQAGYFKEHAVVNDYFAPMICQDVIEGSMAYAYLDDGDILVSSSTHLSGWRMGHAGLVVDGGHASVLQANAVGDVSRISGVSAFTGRVNFMILSPKVDADKKQKVVQSAKEELLGIPYNPVAGVVTNKNSIGSTQCAHIVWYAYMQFAGVDLDCDGGTLVTPKDIANSDLVEVVQVFGFDPEKLWK